MNVNFTKPPSVLDQDPYFNNVSLLMHMNGVSGSKNFVDSSANNIQSTAIGNIEVSSARTQFGNGAAFLFGNGTGNYIRVSGNPNLAVGTGDYTLEMWAYVNSDNAFVIFDAAPINSPGSRPDAFLFYIENTRQPRFFGGGITITTPVASFPIDQWAHLALVRNTGTTTIYINGTGISNSTVFYNATIATGGCLIGGLADNLNFTSNGYIDELRLTKGVARYTGNFTPPTTEFPDNFSQPRSVRFLKSNDGKKTLLRPVNLPTAASNPWSSVLNSFYSSNIVAAYDFSSGSASTIPAKIGPELQIYTPGTISYSPSGAAFTRYPEQEQIICSADSNQTININYPCTLLYIGKTINNLNPQRIIMAVQPIKYNQTNTTNALIFSRSQGLLPFNGIDNNYFNYAPDGSEWYFIAISFETNGISRYSIRKSSGNLNGTITTETSPTNFDGYIGFGAGLTSELDFNFDGTLKLALVINQSFSTETEMNNLFNTFINGGPASDLPLQ